MARSFHWFSQSVYSETESTILTVQDQVLSMRVYAAKIMKLDVSTLMCRLCSQQEETIQHLQLAVPCWPLLVICLIITWQHGFSTGIYVPFLVYPLSPVGTPMSLYQWWRTGRLRFCGTLVSTRWQQLGVIAQIQWCSSRGTLLVFCCWRSRALLI